MKTNLPVTQREIDYPEHYVFVTKTDPKGIITYANDSFVEISGFTRDELVGKNHNMVRHPDMPPWAFADLWETVKKGYPWCGIVKNRAKNGDHYWVKASVSPIKDAGNIIGYISLRKKPTRQEVAEAEKLYKSAAVSAPKVRYLIKHLPLQIKLQILIQPVLFILLAGGIYAISGYLKERMAESLTVIVKNLANEVIDGANMLMVTGQISDPENRKLLIKKISSTPNVVDIKLVRAEQVVQQFGPGLPEEHISDDLERSVIQNKQSIYAFEERDGKNVFRAITPYVVSHNFHGTDCLNCHKVDVGSVNGASDISIDIAGNIAEYKKVILLLIAGQLATQIFLFFFIGWAVKKFVSQRVGLINEHLDNLVNGNSNMSNHADISGRDEMGEILCSVQSTKVMMASVIDHITAAAHHIDERALHLAEAIKAVSEGSSAQADSAERMAAAVQEMSVSVQQITDNTSEVKNISQESILIANDGKEVVDKAIAEMQQINKSVSKAVDSVNHLGEQSVQIQKIIAIINEIAEQTNLLSLNAAIEAARAGEFGRGFAVVADEVRKLAGKTAGATKEIEMMVQNINSATKTTIEEMHEMAGRVSSGTRLVDHAGGVISRINEGAARVMEGVEDILMSLKEQSAASQEVASNVEKIARMAEQNKSSVLDVNDTTHSLETFSEELMGSVKHFKI